MTLMKLKKTHAALVFCALAAQGAGAATISFDVNPFTGSTALTTPGRQVFNGLERTLGSFDVGNDVFAFNANVFGLGTSLTFVNALASGLPATGADVIVLQNSDNDGNPATVFGAGTAANLIANALSADGDGFFVYFNSALNVNRLVYSTNLNDNTADLSILARISSPAGQAAINALPTFRAENFAAVPEPSSYALALAALMGVAVVSRRPKKIAS